MNQKIEIWKRKLAKEEWKKKKAVWDRLKQAHPPKKVDGYPEWLINNLAKEMQNEIDKDILEQLTNIGIIK